MPKPSKCAAIKAVIKAGNGKLLKLCPFITDRRKFRSQTSDNRGGKSQRRSEKRREEKKREEKRREEERRSAKRRSQKKEDPGVRKSGKVAKRGGCGAIRPDER